MANKRINQLDEVAKLSGGDYFPLYQGLSTYSTRLSNIENFIVNNINLNNKVSAYFDPSKSYNINLANNTVTTASINSKAVTTDKLNDFSVTDLKLASNSVTIDKLSSNSVSTVKLVDKAVTTDKLNDFSVTDLKLASNSVTIDKLSSNSVSTVKLVDKAVTTDKLGNIIKPNGGLDIDSNGLSISNVDAISGSTIIYLDEKWVRKRISPENFNNVDPENLPYPDMANISFNNNLKSWVVNSPEKTIIVEQGYIKYLANLSQASSGYAALTNDNRVIAWGNLHPSKFGGSVITTVIPTLNVRVPFWKLYDGYKDSKKYAPYGGDYLDENKTASIGALSWNVSSGVALVYPDEDIEAGGDIWVCGTNVGELSTAYIDPRGITISNDRDYIVIAEAKNGGIRKIIPEIEFRYINPLSAIPLPSDIISNKVELSGIPSSNVNGLSVKEQYIVSCDHQIKFIDYLGNVIDIAGSPTANNNATDGQKGGIPGTGSASRFNTPNGIAQDLSTGDIYVCDNLNHNIRRIKNDTDKNTVIIAGVSGIQRGTVALSGDANGERYTARFHSPRKIVIDPTNRNIMYVSDNHRIRKLTTTELERPTDKWYVNTIAGSSRAAGVTDAIGTNARFNTPTGLAISNDGSTLYIADTENKCIRTLNTSTSAVSTYVAGDVYLAAAFNAPTDICRGENDNTFYVSDTANFNIKKIVIDSTTGIVSAFKFAGTGAAGNATGILSKASFKDPRGLRFIDNRLYIVDTGNFNIKMINLTATTPSLSIIAGTGASGFLDGPIGTGSKFLAPVQIEYDGVSALFVSDTGRIRKIVLSGNYPVTTVAGTGVINTADSLSALKANLGYPTGMAYDKVTKKLYFSDSIAIRQVDFATPNHPVTTIAGSSEGYQNATNGLNAKFGKLRKSIKLLGDMLYIAEYNSNSIRTVELSGTKKVDTIIGAPARKSLKYGVGSLAGVPNPASIEAIGKNLYILSQTSHVIVKSNTDFPNNVSLFSGSVKGNLDTTKSVINWKPMALYLDQDSNYLYFTDTLGDRVGYINTGSSSKDIVFYNNNSRGAFGIGNMTNKSTAGFIKTIILENEKEVKFKSFKRIGTNYPFFAALDIDDSLWVWGYSRHGAFGIGYGKSGATAAAMVSINPTKIKQFSGQIKDYAITASDGTSSLLTIITKDGKIRSAGTNTRGQLGRGAAPVAEASHNHSHFKFEICKKSFGGVTSEINDADLLSDGLYSGHLNNYYIDREGYLWVCGDDNFGQMGKGSTSTVTYNNFERIEELSNVKKVIVSGKDNPTIFALLKDGRLFSWGYNGVDIGQCLVNSIIDIAITSPTQCYNYDKSSTVDNAIDIFVSDNAVKDQTMIGYLDSDNYVYFGGYKADVFPPDFPVNTPFFKRFNMKNVTSSVQIAGEDSLIHRENGTVYRVTNTGPQKVL